MPPDRAAGKLMRAAARDVRAMRGLQDPAIGDIEVFGFHAQQAAEKLLKAWLASAGIPYRFTHDLSELFKVLAGGGLDGSRFEELMDLTAFATVYRYDDADAWSLRIDRSETLGLIEALFAHVESLLQPPRGSQ